MQEYFWSENSSQTCNGDNTINTANNKKFALRLLRNRWRI
jgi:hypothetical protein